MKIKLPTLAKKYLPSFDIVNLAKEKQVKSQHTTITKLIPTELDLILPKSTQRNQLNQSINQPQKHTHTLTIIITAPTMLELGAMVPELN